VKRYLVVLGAVTLGAAATVGFSIATDNDDPSPGRTGAVVLEQSGSAEVAGVTLRIRSATFSGSETLLEVTASRDGKSLEAREFRIPVGAVQVDSILAKAGAVTGARSTDSVFVELPPISRAGNATATIASIGLRRSGATGSDQAAGPWIIRLRGPTSSEFPALMKVESFASGTLDLSGRPILINATRSTSRTIVEYTPPPGLTELNPPRLSSDGNSPIVPFQVGDVGTVRRASYPATKFGTTISLEFGPYSQLDAASNSVVVALGDALVRAGKELRMSGEVALLPTDTVAGNNAIPSTFEITELQAIPVPNPQQFGRRTPSGKVNVLRFRVAGTFERNMDPSEPSPYTGTPSVLDARGTPMRMLSVNSHFTKDGSGGGVHEGETTLEFYLEPEMDISRVTLLLGQSQRVVSGNWKATLSPLR